MPELPEVEVVKQSLQKYILNKKLIKIIVKNKNNGLLKKFITEL